MKIQVYSDDDVMQIFDYCEDRGFYCEILPNEPVNGICVKIDESNLSADDMYHLEMFTSDFE